MITATHLRSRLLQLDAQIVEQRRLLNELQQTRSDVERELHATATFPVLTLPPEITTEIFIHLLELSPSCIPGQNSPPVVLTSVCRQWRGIALATPILWSELEVRFDTIPSRLISESGLVEGLADQWLARAGNRPLSLDFECREDLFALSRVRDLIHRWSHRMQYLGVQIGYRDIRPLGLDSTAFPLLERAEIGCDDDSGVVFGVAPCFRDLRLLFATDSLSTYTLPWPQLTKFIGPVLWDMELFTLAPNLTEVTCTFELGHHASLPNVTHPNLISLTTDYWADVLQHLTLPALRYLDVSMDDECARYGPRSCASLESFLVRSAPPLLSLSLSLAASDEEDDEECFDFGPCIRLVGGTLETLKVSEISNNLMSFMASILHPHSLPHIRTLSFTDICGPSDLSAIVHLLHRLNTLRTASFIWTSSPFLDKVMFVHASTPASCRDTISGHLSRLAQKGMDIYLGTTGKNYLSIDEDRCIDASHPF